MATTTVEERAEAAKMRSSSPKQTSKNNSLDGIPQVVLDTGLFKYILVRVTDSNARDGFRYLVRGKCKAKYHKDVAQPLVDQFYQLGIRYEIVGGGRMEHDSQSKKIFIYGFSYGFPWEDEECRHDITAEVCKAKYPEYDVTWSSEGY
mmetsp:Transcript_22827/g.31804  ORF Transcript_22827/g.31804 Transcript_22827/m.31804 type:complete len:148 (+) Transcript_22827:352-795(+)